MRQKINYSKVDTRCDRIYYKVRLVLQSVTEVYHKVRRVLQSVTVTTRPDKTPHKKLIETWIF